MGPKSDADACTAIFENLEASANIQDILKRVLFDQATPVPIRDYLNQPVVSTASAEAAGFDVFLTTDKNLCYQQKLVGRKIAIVVLGVQQWPQRRPHMQRVIDAVNAALPGIYIEI